jgi:transcriptional regulator with XRE-family HTH domain
MTGEELKKLRLSMALSQEAFGKLIGCRPYQISRWESGHFGISRLYVEKLEKIRGEHGNANGAP